MIILPAIDIIDGKPVRLYQGDFDKKEVVGEDVLEIAKSFENTGAEWVHIVDLDGARTGKTVNREIIFKLVSELSISIEVGGGMRDKETIESYIKAGVKRIILGTKAADDLAFVEDMVKSYGDSIAVGIDCKDGFVATKGWETGTRLHYIDFAKEVEILGVKTVILTDISKDGTLMGPNFEMLREVQENVGMQIIASGGVKDLEDIRKLKEMGFYGAIAGKAIYSGNLSLSQALNI
ncbi:MAG: 1-(5-phosphoribosyl)-5-[(5-phosphoribosylamino)methylideneamino]imidazole-4-carboxamide isomerase [Tissierellia bacterium]|nr:1-(5-phosphoribosyl)-5-[(5-phosphoribosylamino)methylideneamino]imidazole-4-carboxamide isomerase [Tissierellia bacterium]